MHRFMCIAVGIVGLLVYGCLHAQTGRTSDVPMVESLFSGAFCGNASDAGKAPKAVWIDRRQDLMDRWKQIHSHQQGGAIPPLPEVAWDTHALVVVYMGQRTTGGYGLSLAHPQTVRLAEGAAIVRVNWKEPPANAFVTQVITHPCLGLKIERGAYRSVVIVDQNGIQRATIDLAQTK